MNLNQVFRQTGRQLGELASVVNLTGAASALSDITGATPTDFPGVFIVDAPKANLVVEMRRSLTLVLDGSDAAIVAIACAPTSLGAVPSLVTDGTEITNQSLTVSGVLTIIMRARFVTIGASGFLDVETRYLFGDTFPESEAPRFQTLIACDTSDQVAFGLTLTPNTTFGAASSATQRETSAHTTQE